MIPIINEHKARTAGSKCFNQDFQESVFRQSQCLTIPVKLTMGRKFWTSSWWKISLRPMKHGSPPLLQSSTWWKSAGGKARRICAGFQCFPRHSWIWNPSLQNTIERGGFACVLTWRNSFWPTEGSWIYDGQVKFDSPREHFGWGNKLDWRYNLSITDGTHINSAIIRTTQNCVNRSGCMQPRNFGSRQTSTNPFW